MITVIEGSQGSGKTMLCCHLAHLDWKEGKMIYSNVDFPKMRGSPNYVYLESLKQLVELQVSKGTLIIDEYTLWGGYGRNSGSKENKNNNLEIVLQCRKKNLQMIVTTQKFQLIDKVTREQTDCLITCSKNIMQGGKLIPVISNIPLPLGTEFFIACEFIHFGLNVSRQFYFRGNDYIDMYDTLQLQKIQSLPKEEKKKK